MNCSKKFKTAVVCAALLVCLGVQSPVSAAVGDVAVAPWSGTGSFSMLERQINSLVTPRASETYYVTIPARSALRASSNFSMAAGETITIDASYTPTTAELDVGLIYSDGSFHYFTVTGGRIVKTIRMEEAGTYTLAIRNNAYYAVNVSGSVTY